MSYPVYTNRLIGEAHTAAGTSTYTVPSGLTVICTDVTVVGGGESLTADLYVAGIAFGQHGLTGDASGNAWQWQGRQVAYGGEELQVQVTGAAYVTMTGYTFTA